MQSCSRFQRTESSTSYPGLFRRGTEAIEDAFFSAQESWLLRGGADIYTLAWAQLEGMIWWSQIMYTLPFASMTAKAPEGL